VISGKNIQYCGFSIFSKLGGWGIIGCNISE